MDMCLQMENNELVVSHWGEGDSVVSRGKPSGLLADNTWHRIELIETSTSHITVLDNQVIANVTDNLDLHSFISRRTVRIFIGGMAPTIQAIAKALKYSGVHQNFRGCVDQVSINGILLSDGVASVSTVNASTCEGGRLCIPSRQLDNYCQCARGFIPVDGQCTQVDDQCVNHCQNGGTCESRTVDGNNSKTITVIVCVCADGFTGRLCETASACVPNPCPTDRPTCIGPTPGEGYRCVCEKTSPCTGTALTGNDNELSPAIIAVASLLGVLLSALILVLFFVIWYKRKRTKSYKITHDSPSTVSVTSLSEMSSTAKLKGSSTKTIDKLLDSKEVKETSVDISPYQHSNPVYLDSNHSLNKQTTETVEDSSIPRENNPQERDENKTIPKSNTQEITVEVHTPRPSAPVPGHCDSPDIDRSAQIPPGMDPDIISEAGASSFVDDGMVLPPVDVDSISDVVKLQMLPEYITMATNPRPPLTFYRIYGPSNQRPTFHWSSKQNTSTETSESLQGGHLPSSIARLAKTPIRTVSPDSDSQTGSHGLFASVDSTDTSTITGTADQLKANSPNQTARQTKEETRSKMVPTGFSHSQREQTLSQETVGLSNVELELLTPLSAAGSLDDLRATPGGWAEGDGVSSDTEDGILVSRTRGSLPAPRHHLEPVARLTTQQLGKTPSGSAPVVFYPHETPSLRNKTQSSLDTVQTLNSDSATDCSTFIEFPRAPEEAEMANNYPTVFLNLNRHKSIHRPQEEFV